MGEVPTPNPVPTQSKFPWKTVFRTVFQAVVGFAVMAPFLWNAATGQNADEATGWAAVALAICAGVTRVMALPQVNDWLKRFVPFLAAN